MSQAADRRLSYDKNLLREADAIFQQQMQSRPNIGGNGFASSFQASPQPPTSDDHVRLATPSDNRLPFWRTTKGKVLIAVLVIVIIGAVVGAAVGTTVHKSTNTPVPKSQSTNSNKSRTNPITPSSTNTRSGGGSGTPGANTGTSPNKLTTTPTSPGPQRPPTAISTIGTPIETMPVGGHHIRQ